MSGWIKLHRRFKKHWLYDSKEPYTKREAWIDILLEVSYTEQKVNIGNEMFVCKSGQSLNSLDTWGERWKWNKSKVRRFLKLLESDSMIVTESVQKTTRLTVVNFETYQDARNAGETQMKRKRNTDETQTTPNKKEKKEQEGEEGKEVVSKKMFSVKQYGYRKDVEEEVLNFFENCSSIGKTHKKTERASVLFCNKVNQFIKSYGESETIKCINLAIENNWKTIYEPRGNTVGRFQTQNTTSITKTGTGAFA